MGDLGINGRIILKLGLSKTGWERTDWIHATVDRTKRQVIVNMVMNICIP